jgi:hypothetical protein
LSFNAKINPSSLILWLHRKKCWCCCSISILSLCSTCLLLTFGKQRDIVCLVTCWKFIRTIIAIWVSKRWEIKLLPYQNKRKGVVKTTNSHGQYL